MLFVLDFSVIFAFPKCNFVNVVIPYIKIINIYPKWPLHLLLLPILVFQIYISVKRNLKGSFTEVVVFLHYH